MSPVEDTAPPRRIVAAIDSSSAAVSGLEFGADLARRFRAELVTVFVESADLFRVAELPGSSEIGLYSASLRRIEPRDLELQLRAHATRASRATERIARRFEVAWSFRVLRGRAPGAVLDSLGEPGLVAIHGASEVIVSRRDVIAGYEDSEAGRRAATTAAELVRSGGRRLRVLLSAADRDHRQRREVERLLAAAGVAGRIEEFAGESGERLREAVRGSPEALLVLPARSTDRVPRGSDRIETVFF